MFRLFSTSDAQLVRQTLAGRRDAFGTLVERYQPVAYAVAYARVNAHMDAEDVAQESLLAAYQRLDTLRDPARFGAWLAGIARHCASRVRERRLHDATVAERHNGEEPVVMPDHERRKLWELIRAEIDCLNEPDREVVLLHYFAGKSSREIASVTDATSGAVRKRLQRARETLGSRLLERVAEPAQPDREKTQHIMGLIAASPAAWEAAGRGAGAIPVTGGITMSKIVGFVAIVGALVGGAYVLNREATPLGKELDPIKTTIEPSVAELGAGDADVKVAASSLSSQTPETTPSESAQYPIELQGVVYDAEGQPAPNVLVNIRFFTRSELVTGQYDSQTPPAEQTVRSDANGYVLAQFRVASGSATRPIAEWRASMPGAYIYLRTSAGPVVNRNAFPLRLTSTGRISGRVTGPKSAPIRGAKVRPFQFESNNGQRSSLMPDGEGVSTGPDGNYAHNRLYEGRWKLLVEAPGYAGIVTEFAETGTDLDVTLEPAIPLSGVVIDEDADEPVPDLRIVLVRRDCWLEMHEVVTGDEGQYAFPSLAAAMYSVYPVDRERFVSSDQATIEVKQPRADYTIAMRRGAVITGRVTDAQTGQPISGVVAAAGLVDPGTDSHPRTHMRSEPTASDGVYTIEGLPDGEYRVGFSGPPALPPTTETVRETLPVVNAESGRIYSGLDVAFDRLYPVSGVVRDPDGNPLGGISVIDYDLADADRYRNRFLFHPPVTDVNGRFTLWIPKSTDRLVLRGISVTWATRDVGPVPVGAGGIEDVALTAYPAGRIFGMVKSPEGTAIPSADVAHEALNSTAMGDVPENERSAFGAGSVWTDDRGRFCLVGLPPDDYTFTYRGVSHAVSLGPGEAVGDVVIQFTASGSAAVEGTAFLAGQPTEGVSISFSDGSQSRPLTAVSNEEGSYRVSGIPGGAMHYSADWREYDHGVETSRHLNGAITIPARGVSTFDIDLARDTGTIEGVLTQNGKPRPRAQFIVSTQWDDATFEWVRVMTNDEGFYRISGLPTGDHELILNLKPTVPNDRPHSHQYFYTVQTADSQTTRHDVHFNMGSISVSFSGIGVGEQGRVMLVPEIVDADEMTLAKAHSLIDHALYDTEIETDGTVTIEDVPAGTHTLFFAVYDINAPTDEERFASTRYAYSLVDVAQGQESSLSFALSQ